MNNVFISQSTHTLIGVEVMGILQERIIEAMKRYEDRKYDIIYVHMLDSPIWVALSGGSKTKSNSMIVGEVVHQGAERVLDDVEEKCRTLHVNIDNVVPPALERFIKFDSNGKPYVEICGKADGFYNDFPVELKTTRSNRKPRTPSKEWIRRARLYAWLYGKSKGILVIFNVITGEEVDHVLDAFTDEEVREMVEKWLRGEFPSPTLPLHMRMGGNHEGGKN
jgi:hypothetical protein